MTVETASQVQYYYDLNPTEEDLMGQNTLQGDAVDHLYHVLKWMYRAEGWFMPRDLNLYETIAPMEHPITPDLALFKGIRKQDLPAYMPSWQIGPWNPLTPQGPVPPTVVFEIVSENNWEKDLESNPRRYAAMRAKEYFAFIPASMKVPEEVRKIPLRGWKNVDGFPVPMPVDDRGWIWSDELESWLVPEGDFVRLYDAQLNRRLTGEEAEHAALEQERAAREQQRSENERLRARLRELGVDEP